MISCAQTNNEIICDQAVPLPFLSPHLPPPDRRITPKQRRIVVIAEVDKESKS